MNELLTKIIIKSESIWLELKEEGLNYTNYKIRNDLVDRSPVSFGDQITLFNSFTIHKNENLSNSQRLKDLLYTIVLKFAHSEELDIETAWNDFQSAIDMMSIDGMVLMKEYFETTAKKNIN